ncbi:MAG: hypothetical protein EZS28_001384 [Streblomastix strix]|uniref:Uncharacterized protein n=1 Tax=Streblomastix strix TaxID=222440 RepID=A0A5J4X784_9EUKA|nr:MAG: hypothetical protein EZS28_001384 [Streblomastix strix]
MKLAGINTDDFMGYSAKTSGISTRFQEGQSISDAANQSRLTQKSRVLQKHYLKPLQKVKQQIIYSNISSSQYSHSPRETRPAINTSRPSPERSASADTDETNKANGPSQKWDLRDKLMITIPVRYLD